MSMENYEELSWRFELYTHILKGMQDIDNNRVRPLSQVMDNLQKRRLISLQKEKKSAIINDAVLQFSPKREDSLLSERKVKSP